MRLKKILGKLAGAKENQTESSARAPQQERKKKQQKNNYCAKSMMGHIDQFPTPKHQQIWLPF